MEVRGPFQLGIGYAIGTLLATALMTAIGLVQGWWPLLPFKTRLQIGVWLAVSVAVVALAVALFAVARVRRS